VSDPDESESDEGEDMEDTVRDILQGQSESLIDDVIESMLQEDSDFEDEGDVLKEFPLWSTEHQERFLKKRIQLEKELYPYNFYDYLGNEVPAEKLDLNQKEAEEFRQFILSNSRLTEAELTGLLEDKILRFYKIFQTTKEKETKKRKRGHDMFMNSALTMLDNLLHKEHHKLFLKYLEEKENMTSEDFVTQVQANPHLFNELYDRMIHWASNKLGKQFRPRRKRQGG
jgi:hypothetical protein